MALDYIDRVYGMTAQLPVSEQNNLRSQMERAATSIALNIAEGSTGQGNKEQARFLGYAIRSLLETVACQHLISRRNYLHDKQTLRDAYRASEQLFIRLQAFRNSLQKNELRETQEQYLHDPTTPFD